MSPGRKGRSYCCCERTPTQWLRSEDWPSLRLWERQGPGNGRCGASRSWQEGSSFSLLSSLYSRLASPRLLLWDAGDQLKRPLCLSREAASLSSAGEYPLLTGTVQPPGSSVTREQDGPCFLLVGLDLECLVFRWGLDLECLVLKYNLEERPLQCLCFSQPHADVHWWIIVFSSPPEHAMACRSPQSLTTASVAYQTEVAEKNSQ